MNKNESKYFNTAIKMDEALITLLEKKDFAYITIKEICEVAGVNRSTFYLHYQNTSELLEETVGYIIDKHLSYYNLDAANLSVSVENCEKRDLVFMTAEYLVPYLTFVKENQRVFQVAIKRFHVMNMDKVYHDMFIHIFNPILTRFDVSVQKRPYIMKFYLSGVFSIVMEWLQRDCVDDLADIVSTIVDCVLGERNIDGSDA